jgi:hypothetical protein
MGKFNNRYKLTDKLDFIKSSNKFDSKFDARLKLIKKKNLNSDYNFISNEYNHQNYARNQLKKQNISNDSKNSPAVIITGLGNIKKDGDRLKVIKKSVISKLVIADGLNTIVTLKNNQTMLKESHDCIISDNDNIISKKTIGNDLKQIQIRIDNEYSIKNSGFINKKKNNSKNSKIISDNSNNSEVHMDCNDDFLLSTKLISGIKNGNFIENKKPNNGFKLLISNLHPEVTEEDVLVIF